VEVTKLWEEGEIWRCRFFGREEEEEGCLRFIAAFVAMAADEEGEGEGEVARKVQGSGGGRNDEEKMGRCREEKGLA
jgi:hypothetical protein